MKTINLRMPSPRRWRDLPTPAAAAVSIFALLALAMIAGRMRAAQPAAAVPTPALSSIIIIASPLPTIAATPVPTPDMALQHEVEQLRARVSELEQQAQPAPVVEQQVIYVASEPAPAVATPTEQVYQTAAEVAPAPTAAPMVRAEDFKVPDPKAACAFVGCLR